VGSANAGSITSATSVSRQSNANITASVLPAMIALLTEPNTVSATTSSMPLTSLPIRDITSPARWCV
jgi:hypothetical protein